MEKKPQRGVKSPSHTEHARIGVGLLSVSVSTKSKLLPTITANMNFSLIRWVSDRDTSPPALS